MFKFKQQRRTAVIILAFIALLSGLITGRDILFSLAYLLSLLLIISFAWAWVNINYVHISRVTRTRRAQVGRPLEERFTVRNTSRIPKLWLEVRDFSSLPNHFSSHVVNGLGSQASYVWRTTTICRQRGRYQLGPIRLTTSDPFGLFPMQRDLVPTTNVVIYPLTFEIHQFALPLGVLPGGDALRRRTHYVTTNASGVRDYAPGDSFSRIHWRSTARRDRLIVKEFELDPLADIWIVPDMAVFGHVAPRQDLYESKPKWGELPEWMRPQEFKLPETTEEYTVTVAASLAQYFLRNDRAVGMLGYGQTNEIVQPDRGERQMNRILETLSVLRAEGEIPISDMLHAESHLFPRGTTVIVVTPTTQDEWPSAARQLARRGLRVVTVLINPASFGGYRSSDGVLSLLQASGMVAYLVNNGDDLTAVLSQTRKQAGNFTIV
ncbi:MAG: DUF58 domain-containing protein [Anaerolineales bacterium]|nr:DUF58 domain-containing protein [Anaerolineales bacterium]MCB8936800.1 DUF58 domain-containing protein [Ardenticatenaceae bacterium]